MTSQVDRRYLAPMLSPKIFELTIMPTEQCNFRCSYCYEDFSIGRMKPPIVQGIKRLMDTRAPELQVLGIAWFGGEPLAAKDIVFDISEHATGLARKWPQLRYESSMTTNAYFLDRTIFERLSALGVRDFQITLDGWAEQHDVTRKRADGAGTFDRIWSNLLSIRESNAESTFLLRVHLQPHSVETIDTLVDNLIKEFSQDKRFAAIFRVVGNWGGPNSGRFSVLEENVGERVRGELEARWRAARPSGTKSTEPSHEKPYVCYASRPNSLIVRADGGVGKCTVKLKDSRNAIGKINPDGTLEISADRLKPWMRGFNSLDVEELGCPAIGLPKEPVAVVQGTLPLL